MKGKFLKNYHTLLLQNNFEELEHKLSLHFLTYFGKLLPLEYSYLDWLVIKLRPIRKQKTIPYGLNSDYIQSDILVDSRNFVALIQLLNYVQNLDFEIKYGNVYKSVLFTLYFLAIKIGFIASNVLDQHQPNSQLVSKVQTLFVYNPYVYVLDDYQPSGLHMDKIE
uniref:hypothetical protein n=1 Tax=Pleurosigma intermedium TaxID=197753 RepID=UPI00218225D5|nr:hypothetical protein N4L43_pgp096 [Pleurosigma intermedium]UVG42024.1 hypothetical protein [Pleurosigma intermedium]